MSVSPRRIISSPGAGVAGDIRVPGDKSISHRAAMLAAVADGVTEIHGFLEAADCLATVAAIAKMGVAFERPAAGRLRIHGAGLRGLRAPAGALDLGNSGTGMRLLAGLMAGQAFDSLLVGDASLMQRPMERIAAPLRRMGAELRTSEGMPPLAISGGRRLRGCEHRLEFASAQVKSALLLAGLYAEGATRVWEPGVSRDHTERMLEAFGVTVSRAGGAVAIAGASSLVATRIEVPGDFSSAAFFIVAGLIAGSAPLRIRDVGVNPTRTALLDILRRMGGDISVHPVQAPAGEPRADIEVRPSRLRGVVVPPDLVTVAMDELPVLMVAAAVAEGETVVTHAAELRVKESDRLAALADGFAALGVAAEPQADGLRVTGGPVQGGSIDARGDHRIAMSFAVLGSRARSPVIVREAQNVATSFPGFAATARAAGLLIAEEN